MIDEFIKEQDAVLLRGNLEELIAFHHKWNPKLPKMPMEVAEISLHKARTACRTLPMKVRKESKLWLANRGYQSLDDGEVGAAILGLDKLP